MEPNSKIVILNKEGYDSMCRRLSFLEEALHKAILTKHIDGNTAHMVIGNSVCHPKGESCYICRALEV